VRKSDNKLIKERVGRVPSKPLRNGFEKTYRWIAAQLESQKRSEAERLVAR